MKIKKFKPVKLKKDEVATVDWIISFNPKTMELLNIERRVKIKNQKRKND